MNARNNYMKQLIDEAKEMLKELMKKDSSKYYNLLRELILQVSQWFLYFTKSIICKL